MAGDRLVEVVVNDGANNSNLAVAVISVTATNDAPVIAVDPAAAYVENAAAVVLAPLAALSDVDDTELDGALVSITGGSFPGDGDILSVGGVTSNTVNGITFVWMPAQHALVFSGASSVANYEALLRQVQFQSSSDNPTDFSHSPQRTLTWAVTDSESVTTATTTINIVAVNDAPQETVAATAAYTENASPVTISPAATASDVDNSDLIYGEVKIVAGGFDGDVLTVNGLQSGTFLGIDFSYDAGLRRLLFNGPTAVADYQALMQAVQFGSTSENPTNFGANPTRTLGWGLSDGENYSSPAQTTQITITALNDAPINTVPGAQSVAEDTILPIVGVSVADIDSSALTTTLSVLSGILNVIDDAGAGAVVTGNGTASVIITGTAAEINAALVGLAYTGNPNFNGPDTLTVETSDATATDTDIIAITVNPVNDAPVLNLDADSSTTGGVDYLTAFTDGGPAVEIVDTDVLITDSDDIELTSATVTLTNPHTDDVLLFNGTPPTGIAASLYDPLTGILTLTGTATLAAYQTALGQITFDNTGTNPSTETRIIDVVVNDGTVASNLAHAIIEVTQVNNSAPTLDLDGNNSTLPGTSYRTTFTESDPPVAIADTDTLIGDPDIGGTIASATVTLTNPQIGDLLTATLPLPGGIIASAYDPVTGTLTLSNVASFADYETALEAIRFSAAGDTPVAGNRIIQVVVNDGIHDSQPATSLVTVVAANDAPALVVADATYQENAAPVLLLPSAGLTDADDTELNFAAVQITAGSFPGDGDTLTVNGATSGTVTGITFLWDPTLHALVFGGASSVANYQALLQTVQFQSTSDNPTNFDASPQRTLTWFVSDGTDVTTATTTLDIVALDDPAVAEPDAVATTENALIRARAVAGNLFNNNGFGPDSDPDGGTFAVTVVSAGTVGTPITLPSGALLIVNADGTFNYDPNHKFDYLPTLDSGASNLTVTDTFSYAITGGDTATATVTVSGVDTDDILLDSPGDDSLAGGIGEDRYHVNNTFDVVIEAANAGFVDTVVATVDYTLPANNTVERLDMVGSGLTGTGSEGPETLISDGGPNTLIGLGGNDTYYVNHIDDVVIEAANGGSDIVAATVDYTLPLNNSNVEALYMLGSGLTGTGSGGTETLVSSDGPNTLVGLGGDDTYHVNNTDDVVTEAENGGYDTVAATVNYTMPANVEALYMYGSELTGTGSANNDILVSSGGPNTLVGFDGHDTYYVSNTDDVVTEVADGGSDTVVATVDYTMPDHVEALYVNGSELTGTGSSGADTLYTLGANTLVGDDGNDTFVFYAGSADGAIVADFDGNQVNEEDFLLFSGFGTQAQGATFSPIVGTTDQWQIHSGLDGHDETITFSNAAAPQAGDFLFV